MMAIEFLHWVPSSKSRRFLKNKQFFGSFKICPGYDNFLRKKEKKRKKGTNKRVGGKARKVRRH